MTNQMNAKLYKCYCLGCLSLFLFAILALGQGNKAETGQPKQIASVQMPSIIASTGEMELLENGEGDLLPAWTEAEYQKRVAPIMKAKNFLPMVHKPEKLSPQARFGLALGIENDWRINTWVLDGDKEKGYLLYADLNGNGDLSDDAPLQFEHKDGKYFYLFRGTGRDPKSQETYPIAAKIEVTNATLPGESQPRLCLRCHHTTLRRGVIRADNREIAFGLIGTSRNYYSALFDLNGDGQIERNGWSAERYNASERYVRLGESDYEFVIDRYGRSLTLKPLAEKLPPTAILRPGYPAPDFSFADLEGKSHKLSDYRGKVVLLDFWVINCGPCQIDAPRVAEAYAQLHPKGLEIIGINGDDTAEAVKEFMGQKKMTWTQTVQEKWEGPIHNLYRFDSWPTYYLIGKDGTIIAKQNGDGVSLAVLEKLAGLAGK